MATTLIIISSLIIVLVLALRLRSLERLVRSERQRHHEAVLRLTRAVAATSEKLRVAQVAMVDLGMKLEQSEAQIAFSRASSEAIAIAVEDLAERAVLLRKDARGKAQDIVLILDYIGHRGDLCKVLGNENLAAARTALRGLESIVEQVSAEAETALSRMRSKDPASTVGNATSGYNWTGSGNTHYYDRDFSPE